MRLIDWEPRLKAAILASGVHAYGDNDCLLFAARMVEAVTGEDFGTQHRGQYDSALSAARYLKRLGFDSPEAMIDAYLESRPVAFAQRGDLILAGDGIPGVCMGGFALSVFAVEVEGQTVGGLVKVPREHWTKAWRVG